MHELYERIKELEVTSKQQHVANCELVKGVKKLEVENARLLTELAAYDKTMNRIIADDAQRSEQPRNSPEYGRGIEDADRHWRAVLETVLEETIHTIAQQVIQRVSGRRVPDLPNHMED